MELVIGTGGLAKQSLSCLIENNKSSTEELVFFDNVNGTKEFVKHRVINTFEEIEKDSSFIICIGTPKWREYFYEKMIGLDMHPISVISKKAIVLTEIAPGNLILPYALIEHDSCIGIGNLINCYSAIFHDVKIGYFNEIQPGAKLLGSSSIGSNCQIGTNAVILPNINVCSNVIIGAGAVVTKDIIEPGTYVGIPARKLDK